MDTLHKLTNPDNGADISSVYCERGKEVYETVTEHGEGGVEVKTKRVTNSQPFVLKKGETAEVPEHQARWALKAWGFLKCDTIELPKQEPYVVPKVAKKEEKKEEVKVITDETLFPQDDADKLAELKIKGYRNLKGPEREEYDRLKKLINK